VQDPRSARSITLRALCLVAAARVLLTRCPTPTVLRLLSRRRGHVAKHGIDHAAALGAVRRVGPRLGANCLPQSVALAALLQRHGDDPTLILGCRRYGDRDWGAHAWVEVGGRRLEPLVEPEHAELARLPAAQNWEISPAEAERHRS
jgi:hypothetical protein